MASVIDHNDWKMYARQLDFDETDIQSIEHKDHVPEEQRFQFLYQWRQRQTNPTFHDLVEAASDRRLHQLAEKIKDLANGTSRFGFSTCVASVTLLCCGTSVCLMSVCILLGVS